MDKRFIDGLPGDTREASIVRATQATAQSLDQVVCAEGVETVEQADWLFQNGIQQAQGFLCARPMPPEIWINGASKEGRSEFSVGEPGAAFPFLPAKAGAF